MIFKTIANKLQLTDTYVRNPYFTSYIPTYIDICILDKIAGSGMYLHCMCICKYVDIYFTGLAT